LLNNIKSNMSVKLVVFDMAGTTVKDDQDVSKAFQSALLKYNYHVPLTVIDHFMGYEKPYAISQMLHKYEAEKEKITTDLINDIHVEFVDQMIEHYRSTPDIAALPNVEDTFKHLHNEGIKIGINTGFSKDIAQTIIDRLQWQQKGLIDYIMGSDEVEKGRPYPFMIQNMMQRAGITDPQEVVKVGDTEVDIREGQNAKCKFVIGITTGSFTRNELEEFEPTHIIDNITQVIEIISQ
jgi:phosphonatase-like hydrolase